MKTARAFALVLILVLLAGSGCASLGRFAGLGSLVAPEYTAAIQQAQGLLAPNTFNDAETDGYYTYKGQRVDTADLDWVMIGEKRGNMAKAPPPWWFSPDKKTAPSSELDATIARLNSLKIPAAKEPK